MKELDLYWEDCLISQEDKKFLIIRYEEMFKDAKQTSDFLFQNEYYNWAIVSSYYSMYYISLKILAKNHNLKHKSFESHSQVVKALNVLYSKKEISKLLDIAYQKVNFENLPANLLYKGKDIRNKINYDTNYNSNQINQKSTEEFILNVRNKFIEISKKILGE